ncbi:MAG: hypothetical protein ACYCSB_02435 [bacterium]
MSFNLIFIDESESMQRAIATIFQNNPEFNLNLIKEPSSLYKAAKNFNPDVIVLSYNAIDTELKKSITEIKTSKEFSNTPLVLLVPSDLSDNERETLIKLKSDGFIYRPFDKDSFISKIKKVLNVSDAVSNAEEKIYDIASFENKKADGALNSSYSVENSADTADIKDNNNVQGHGGLESSELSQAFENLFKDDTIFKEFQTLNKKEEPAGSAYAIDEESSESSEQSEEIPNIELIAGLNETKEEPFTFSNTALNENSEEINEPEPEPEVYKLNTDLNIKKSEGELNLKILDEQNLVKMDDYLKSIIEKTIEEIKPQIIESIKTALPEIIEKLVKEEIEKIKQQ